MNERTVRSPEATYEGLRRVIQRKYPTYDVEIQDGEYVVVAPHDLVSSNVVVNFTMKLAAWVQSRELGHVFESNAGFEFPDGDKMAPDVTYISRERLPVVPRSFARATPELVVEVRSSRQTERATRHKLESLLAKGVGVGVYVDPGTHAVEIHRADAEPTVLRDGDLFELPDILPGLGFPVDELWPR